MGTKTTLLAVTHTAGSVTATKAAGADMESLKQCAKAACEEAILALTNWKNALPGGDPNITTIAAQITALS